MIVFDSKLNRKACRFFEASEIEQNNIIMELEARESKIFLGDDQTENSVYNAFKEALSELDKSSLYDPCNGDSEIKAFLEAFPEK